MAKHSLQTNKIKTDRDEEPKEPDNPVRDYLHSLVWDKVPRLDKYIASEHEIGA